MVSSVTSDGSLYPRFLFLHLLGGKNVSESDVKLWLYPLQRPYLPHVAKPQPVSDYQWDLQWLLVHGTHDTKFPSSCEKHILF